MPPQEKQLEINGGADAEHEPQFRQIPLEILFSSPVCWRGPKSCQFFKAAHNLIKEDPTMKDFKRELDSDHWGQWGLWAPEGNWKDVLGEEFYKLVTTYISAVNKQDPKGNALTTQTKRKSLWVEDNSSVIELLGIIRNKYEHNALYEDVEKEQLGWFSKRESENGKWEFDETRYAKFWTTRFPQLHCYLWWQFRRFTRSKSTKDTCMQRFYPCDLPEHSNQLLFFPLQLHGALQMQLENGGLDSRYSMQNGDTVRTVEFRNLEKELVNRLLDDSQLLRIVVSADTVKCRWFHKDPSYVDESVTNQINSGDLTAFPAFTGRILVANSISDLVNHVLMECELGNEEDSDNASGKTVIFTSGDNQNDSTQKLKILDLLSHAGVYDVLQNPVNWEELSASVQESVESGGSFKIQGRVLKIGDILPDSETQRNQLLSCLKGKVLNMLLEKECPELLKNLDLPSLPNIYFERRFSRYIDIETVGKLYTNGPDVLLVVDFGLFDVGHLHLVSGIMIALVNASNVWSNIVEHGNSRIFVLVGGPLNFGNFDRQICSTRKINCVRWREDDVFEWVGVIDFESTEAQLSTISNYGSYFEEGKRFDEVDILSSVERNGPILIADKPGMGKSLVLASIAAKLCQKLSNNFVFFICFSQFAEQLPKRKLTRQDIFTALFPFDKSQEFEKNFVKFWLDDESVNKSSRKISFEVMLDGLDEVRMESMPFALDALAILQSEVPGIRLWITFRDHMLEGKNLLLQLKCADYYKLEPFTQDMQVQFIHDYWLWKVGNGKDLPYNADDIKDFARKCVRIPFSRVEADMCGIPLHCRMLAEIYETKILEGDLEWNESNKPCLVDLYDQMLERKLEIYIREKKGICKSLLPLNDPIFNALRVQVRLNHFYYALKLIMGEKVANAFKSRLVLTAQNSINLDLAVLEQGIIEKVHPLTFIHRTFAEFIVARFIANILTGQLLCINKSDPDFELLLWQDAFVATWRQTNHIGNHRIFEAKYQVVCHFVNSLLEKSEMDARHCSELQHFIRCIKSANFAKAMSYSGLCRQAGMMSFAYWRDWNGILAVYLGSQKHLIGLLLSVLLNQKWDEAKYLIENHLAIEWKNLHKYSEQRYGILHWAMLAVCRERYPHIETMKPFLAWILEKDSSLLEQVDRDGRTPLLLVVKEEFRNGFRNVHEHGLQLYELLVTDFGADVHAVDSKNNTVLHSFITKLNAPSTCGARWWWEEHQVFSCFVKFVKFFMRNGCNAGTINTRNSNGHTPLYRAVQVYGKMMLNELETCQEYGADFNLKDELGYTLLQICIEKRLNLDFIVELINCGADITAVNNIGQNAVELAWEIGYFDVVRYLTQ